MVVCSVNKVKLVINITLEYKDHKHKKMLLMRLVLKRNGSIDAHLLGHIQFLKLVLFCLCRSLIAVVFEDKVA